MTQLLYLRRSLDAEMLKLKGTAVLRLAFLTPLVIVGITFVAYWWKGEHLIAKEQGPWWSVTSAVQALFSLLVLPFLITLLTTMVNTIEHRSNGWKLLYTLPLPRNTVYLSKALLLLGLVLANGVVLVMILLAAGVLLVWLRPDLGFQHFQHLELSLLLCLKIYLAALAIVALQFWVSMRWSNFAIAMGVNIVAFALMIVSIIGDWSKLIIANPFAYPMLAMDNEKVFWGPEVFLSAILTVLFLLLGCLDMRRRNVA